MRVNVRGVVTVPAKIRKALGITPGSEVEFLVKGNTIYMKKVKAKSDNSVKPNRGQTKREDE